MKRFSPLAFAFALLIAFCGPLFAQSKQELPIPGGPVATDIPGAKERPDPKIAYKVVFDIAKAAPKVDEVNPGLTGVVRYLNTLAANGVPADHRKIAVVFHQDGTDIVMNNDAFKARYEGHDNPDIALIHEMKKAGVDFRVCGQAVLAHKIDPKTINPDIEAQPVGLDHPHQLADTRLYSYRRQLERGTLRSEFTLLRCRAPAAGARASITLINLGVPAPRAAGMTPPDNGAPKAKCGRLLSEAKPWQVSFSACGNRLPRRPCAGS